MEWTIVGVANAVHQAWSIGLDQGYVNAKKHFAGDGVECEHYSRLWNLLCKFLRARRGAGYDKFCVVIVHRETAGDDHLARQIACLIQHIIYSRPVRGQ